MGFQNKFTYIRIHQHNYTHNNREAFYKEFKYLKIINLLLNKKTPNIIFAILKYPLNYLKLKLIIIYFLPKFLIRLKIRYF